MFKKIIEYLKSVYLEMRKVTWPTRSELVSSTIIVIVISVFVAVVIFILDRIFSIGLGFILR